MLKNSTQNVISNESRKMKSPRRSTLSFLMQFARAYDYANGRTPVVIINN